MGSKHRILHIGIETTSRPIRRNYCLAKAGCRLDLSFCHNFSSFLLWLKLNGPQPTDGAAISFWQTANTLCAQYKRRGSLCSMTVEQNNLPKSFCWHFYWTWLAKQRPSLAMSDGVAITATWQAADQFHLHSMRWPPYESLSACRHAKWNRWDVIAAGPRTPLPQSRGGICPVMDWAAHIYEIMGSFWILVFHVTIPRHKHMVMWDTEHVCKSREWTV